MERLENILFPTPKSFRREPSYKLLNPEPPSLRQRRVSIPLNESSLSPTAELVGWSCGSRNCHWKLEGPHPLFEALAVFGAHNAHKHMGAAHIRKDIITKVLVNEE